MNLEESLRSEWLETNGLGGYASSTILDCHTRKYHGLLAAPVAGLGRFMFLSSLRPVIKVKRMDAGLTDEIKEKAFSLYTAKFPGVFSPTGHQYIDHIETHPCPRTVFKFGGVRFAQTTMMPQGENAVMLRYDLLEADCAVTLQLFPLLACRDIHTCTHSNLAIQVKMFGSGANYHIEPYSGLPAVTLQSSCDLKFFPGPHWHDNFEYLIERKRGYEYQEDLFCPGIFERELSAGDSFVMLAAVGARKGLAPAALWKKESERRQTARNSRAPLALLKERSSDFLITNSRGERSVIAGYHWFGEWGRDTMISLPGLTLHSGRERDCCAVLKTYTKHERGGLLPNFLADAQGDSAYNSVDASLWYFWTIQQYLQKTGDLKSVREEFLPVMGRIIKAFVDGSTGVVRIRPDGLLVCGDRHTQLTWMDATVNGQPVTPRHGLPVEINALWYNALSFYLQLLADQGAVAEAGLLGLQTAFPAAFRARFWLEDGGYLADVAHEDGWRDTAVRPNQIFAVSLPYSCLSSEEGARIVAKVEHDLLTPYGLRTLSPEHPEYRFECRGNQEARDSSYHQGTVWPWLIGHYTEALLRTCSPRRVVAASLRKKISPLLDVHLADHGLGTVAEIFDGNPPHKPRGCISQAWSVAEVIRAFSMLDEVGKK